MSNRPKSPYLSPLTIVFVAGFLIIFGLLITKRFPFPTTPTPIITASDIVLPTDTPYTPPITSTVTAVARDNISCIFEHSEHIDLTISQFAIISIVATNRSGEWGLVRLSEGLDCWVELRWLDLNNKNPNSLPTANFTPPPTKTPIPISTPGIFATTPPPRLIIRWKILSYDCLNGRATGAIIDLDVSGGNPEYKFSLELPIYAQPGQVVSITVSSNTDDGEPSEVISFTVPSATNTSYFNCERSGNNEGPPLPPTDPPPTDPPTEDPTEDPPPPEPPVCYNPQGKVIPCH